MLLVSQSQALRKRFGTAMLLIGLALVISVSSAAYQKGEFVILTLAFVVAGFSSFEFARLFCRDPRTLKIDKVRGFLLFLLVITPIVTALSTAIKWINLGSISEISESSFVFLIASSAAFVAYPVLLASRDLSSAAELRSAVGPAFSLISLGGAAMVLLGSVPGSAISMWWLVAVVIASDSSAFFAGKWWGKTKLAPAISPNKTVEGSLAGIVGAALSAVILFVLIRGPINSVIEALIFGGLVSVFAQIGDLLKSYMKRLRAVKDFGALFPGHGGVLDRCDGMLFASIFVLLLTVIRS